MSATELQLLTHTGFGVLSFCLSGSVTSRSAPRDDLLLDRDVNDSSACVSHLDLLLDRDVSDSSVCVSHLDLFLDRDMNGS